jgi:DNA segregation ATPase FtsK/SpoIIIE-like protein
VRNRHGATGLAARESVRFSVTGQIKHICPGPVVTTYEFKPDQA